MEALRLLLVDDEPHILNALTRHLRHLFRNARPALYVEFESDPRRALQRLRERSYAVVISDYRMPITTGVELLQAVRDLQPHCVRIMLSGQVDRDGLAGAINDAQVHRFMSKPWRDDELEEQVKTGLAQYRRDRQHAEVLDEVALQQGQLSRQEAELRRLERLEPGITQVKRDATGAVLMDLS